MSTPTAATPAQTISEWESRLAAIRVQHPPKHIEIGPDAWNYIATGAGPAAVLLLPGGLGTAESSFTRIEQLVLRSNSGSDLCIPCSSAHS